MCEKNEMIDIVDYHLQRIAESVRGVIVIDNKAEAERLEERLTKEKIYFEKRYELNAWSFYFETEKKEIVETGLFCLTDLIRHKIENYQTGESLEIEVGLKEVLGLIGGRKGIVSGCYLKSTGFLVLKLDRQEVLKEQQKIIKD